MHIPDGLVDVPTAAAGAVVAVGGVAIAGRRTAARLKDRATTLPAVVAAYLLIGQLLVIPVGFGTSAHLIGTGLAVALVGPSIAIVCVATVVVLQALVLADGGVTAIGLNIVNDGIVPALVAYGVLCLVAPVVRRDRRRAPAAAGIAAALAALAAGLAAATELAIGGSDVVSPATVYAALGGSHVVVAGIEGALTAAIIAVIQGLRPDYLSMPGLTPPTAAAPATTVPQPVARRSRDAGGSPATGPATSPGVRP